MTLNRKNFFKVLGITGVSLVLGKELKAAPKKEGKVEFSGILCDSTRCAGCQTRESACTDSATIIYLKQKESNTW